MLRPVDNSLWVAEQPLQLLVGNLEARMTVVRLRTGGLFVHSPIAPDNALVAALENIGSVVVVVAPNKTHHFFARRFCDAFPKAEFWSAPGLATKRPDLGFANVIGTSGREPPWAGDLEHIHVRGIPVLEEVAFFHPRSRTLILTDLVFNIPADIHTDWRLRLFLRLNGARGCFGPTRLVRMLVRDSEALTASLRKILEWDFDRVIMSHGEILDHGGRAALAQAFALRSTNQTKPSGSH